MIWVIGCNGMLGSEICRQLQQSKHDFTGTGSDIDITRPESLENFFKSTESQIYVKSHKKSDPDNGKIKWIINCAAYTQVDKAEEEPEKAKAVNTIGALNLARVARAHNAKLIHISTDYVFDGMGTVPYTEKSEKNPQCVYGKTKSEGEEAITSSMTQYYILRTSWLYGFSGKNFVTTIARLLNSNDEINVINDQKGSPTFTADLAQAVLKIIERSEKATSFFGKNSAPAFGIYNFSDEGETTWFDFASEIKKNGEKLGILSANCTVKPCSTADYPTKAMRPAYSVLSKEKIRQELKIKIPDWKDSLYRFMSDKNFTI